MLESDMDKDLFYMQRCLDLASLGEGNVAPNPMVGAVIVCNNIIIGEGYHHQFGGPHAEVNAIRSVKNPEALNKATLYVNLEPCSHYGKTPPCADLVIKSKIPRIVIAMEDPNPSVAGKGVNMLKKAGCEVKLDVLKNEALHLNRSFVCFHTKKRPYVVLKWAETKDGFIDKKRINKEKGIHWITSPQSQILVHQWRNEIPAILVGSKTILNDNPELTVRHVNGTNPLRLVIDKNLETVTGAKVLDGSTPTVIYTKKSNQNSQNIEWVPLDFSKEIIPQILEDLYRRNINAVMIEGGKTTLEHFIHSNLWDEARVLIGNNYFGEGLAAPSINGLVPVYEDFIGKDELRVYLNRKKIIECP